MGYKISGSKSHAARVIVLKESDWSIESNTVVSGSGDYEIENLVSGTKTVIARNSDGWVKGYGNVEAISFTQARGVYGGGYGTSANPMNTIDYITIASAGDAQDFGDLTQSRSDLAAVSNGEHNRGVFGGGYTDVFVATMDYVTITNIGNASSFGSLTVSRNGLAGASNGTNERGIYGGGYGSGGAKNVIDYITINSASGATNFGDLTYNQNELNATSNATNDRAVFGGGYYINISYVITISSTCDAANFGNLSLKRYDPGATSNGTNNRAVFAGGDPTHTDTTTNVMDYFTISTLGNASDFGDLTVDRFAVEGLSNGTFNRGIFAGGKRGSYSSNVIGTIDFITINSLGNASSFGGLQGNKCWGGATSNA